MLFEKVKNQSWTLTTVGLIRSIYAIDVAITFEGDINAVTAIAFKLIGATGWVTYEYRTENIVIKN